MFGLKYTELDIVPMKVITDEREFVDDIMLDVEGMVEFLYKYNGRSKSSCPNTSDWLDAFGDADEIFCVTITSALSGSYNSACAAKQIYESENEGRRVHVFDSLSAGPEISLAVEKIEECIRKGMAFEEICSAVDDYMSKTGLAFLLKSLKNFANNGRVSPIVAKLVGIAGVCIVGKASDEGTLEPIHKCRGEYRSFERLVEHLEASGYNSGKISIAHCQNDEGAQVLKMMMLEKFKNAKIEIHRCRGLCSFYAEKGGLLIGFEKG